MKKFLASLLSLTMFCSSVVVFCSAQDDSDSLKKVSSVKVGDSQEPVISETPEQIPVEGTAPEVKASSFSEIYDNFVRNAGAFYNGHQKEIAITCITTAVVAVITTTAYIFRNEIKDLAQKTAKTVKEFYQKTIQQYL